MRKKAIVVHSGGMDSSLCLALAAKEFGHNNILSLSFAYNQRHSQELQQAKKISGDLRIDHTVLAIDCLQEITSNALLNKSEQICHAEGSAPNTLVVGRNGLMARIAAIHAHHLGAQAIYLGVIEVEEANSGYRDCSRTYFDKMEEILKIDLDNPHFEIRTPLVKMTKLQTLELAHQLDILPYLLEETITCYEGIPKLGCQVCPACTLRNEGIKEFYQRYPEIKLPYMA